MGSANEAERHQTEVPDTLDLAERAELAINGLARTVDPDDEYMQYFQVYMNARPPYLQHHGHDIFCTPKFADAIPRLRTMCGSDRYSDIDQGMLGVLTGYLDERDGLYYARLSSHRPWHMKAYGNDPVNEDVGLPQPSGMMMIVLMMRRAVDDTTRWDGHIQKLARGLESIAVHKDDYAYFPVGGPNGTFARLRSGWLKTDEPQDEHEGGEGSVVAKQGYSMLGCSMWAGLTGDEQALEFAGKLARFVMKRKFWNGVSDLPQCSASERGHADSHFHARAQGLRGVLQYGLVAGDPRACDFVRSSYEYMRTFGIPELGFVPTYHKPRPHHWGYMEGCYLRDVIWMAVKLSESGYGDYWEDVDRLVRNHLVEAQWVDKAMLERIVAHSPERRPGSEYNLWHDDKHRQVTQYPGFEYAGDDVIDRVWGTFGSLLGADSMDLPWIMQCCSPNAALGLYYAWEAITRCDGDHARVNLLLNRAAPWVDIDSYLPYEGRVVIRNKTASRISVRIPPWVGRSQLQCRVAGAVREPQWIGRYVTFSGLGPTDEVDLQFPVPERTISTLGHAGTPKETEYTIRLRGNTALDVSPRDESPRSYQYYRREHMKGSTAPKKSATRYVAPVTPWW